MGILDEIQQRLGLLNTPANLPSSPAQAPFSLAGTMTPDASAMTPETFANPLVENIMGGLASLPQRAMRSAADYQQTGNYDPGPILEAAMLPMGTGAIAGLPLRAGEVALGAGAIRPTLRAADDGTKLNIAPEGMQVPDYGQGLSWGMTAYRTTPKIGEHADIPALKIRDVRLPEDMRGQGIGVDMYQHAADLAKDEGRAFHSDSTVTQAAVAPWAALKSRGYNVQTSPNIIKRQGPPEAPQLTRYETENGDPVFFIPRGRS